MRQFAMATVFLAAFASLAAVSLSPGPAGAQSLTDEINKQSGAFAGTQGANLKNADPRLLMAQIIKIFLTLIGTLFLAYTTYGGFLVFTAAGDADRIEHAKKIIFYGSIGVLIVLTAYSIAWFIWQMWLDAQNQNPFGSFFEWGVQPDTSQFYIKDPLYGPTVPKELGPL